jgi:hypothetical protein
MVAPILSSSDIKNIEAFKACHPIGRLLTEVKDVWKFSVGDTLVRYKMHEYPRELDLVSDACPVPKKFRVMKIDDLGVPWVKQLSVRGGLGTQLTNLVEGWCNGRYRYAVDPEQIDSILLGYKYDPRIEYRKLRNENPSYGKTKTK